MHKRLALCAFGLSLALAASASFGQGDYPTRFVRFTELAVEPRTNTPEEFQALLESDRKRWADVVRNAGIKAE